MKDLFRVFLRIPEKNRTIAYSLMTMIKNLFYFVFKIVVGIVFETPILIVIAIYNLLISAIMVNCSRGLLKNHDDLKDCKTYIRGGIILLISSLLYIIYNLYQVENPYKKDYNITIAAVIGIMAVITIAISVNGLIKTKGRTMLVQEYKFTKFATALNNLVLTQIAILSLWPIAYAHFYNTLIGVINGMIIFAFGLYIVINGLLRMKVYTSGITNAKQQKIEKSNKL